MLTDVDGANAAHDSVDATFLATSFIDNTFGDAFWAIVLNAEKECPSFAVESRPVTDDI